ncbi:hypothetical protein SmJEL517_g04035 [Synchytrium microbalum]|uniref:Uncharacterized protein n=1 Tax=Synchytrium microbalum TaxID=1806994 RepID=A0A507BTZ9_9FUNG|nr:uncharacterized protein SmJEL517_g04035 [Synchytrium microbalum]TPX32990.1 hypothetical protein SmJEL517_g04035 [Synchytrium microbalum]
MELCNILDCRRLQHQHIHDRIIHDWSGNVMVAGMDRRVARIRNCSWILGAQCNSWQSLSYYLSGVY